VSRPFQDASNVAVEAVPHVGLRLPDALLHALASGTEPPVDVVWCNTSPALRAARRSACESLAGAPVLRELATRARAAQLAGLGDSWPIAETYVTHYVLVYQRHLYEPRAPESWRVLERPDHAKRIVLYPGGNGFYPVAQVLGGGKLAGIPHDMAACWTAVRRIRPQLGTSSYSVTLHEALRRREIDLCFRALPNVLAFQADGLNVDWTAPREGITDTTDAMWIPRGLPPEVVACARAYIWFALSAAVQDRWCGLLGTLPVNRNARARHAVFTRDHMPTDPDDLDATLHVPEHIKAIHEPEWEINFEGQSQELSIKGMRARS
jgi:putative spermidine/putrescine transport system substrate-binding protein